MRYLSLLSITEGNTTMWLSRDNMRGLIEVIHNKRLSYFSSPVGFASDLACWNFWEMRSELYSENLYSKLEISLHMFQSFANCCLKLEISHLWPVDRSPLSWFLCPWDLTRDITFLPCLLHHRIFWVICVSYKECWLLLMGVIWKLTPCIPGVLIEC